MTATADNQTTATTWRSRIVGSGEESPDQLLANPRNWRVHPKVQQEALADVLDEVGWVQQVIVNQRTGHLIDGHLRVTLANRRGEPTIPVVYVDLDEHEEGLALATLDPLAAMAATDVDKLDELLGELASGSDAMRQTLGAMHERAGGAERNEMRLDPGGLVEDDERLAKWGVKRDQIWEIGPHRLMCGDAVSSGNVAALFAGKRAEMVWTDPPYGVLIGNKREMGKGGSMSARKASNLGNDGLDRVGLNNLLRGAFDLAVEHCERGATWYIAAPVGDRLRVFVDVLDDLGVWRQTIVWIKNQATFSPMGINYHNQFEVLLHGWVPNGAHRYHGDRKQTTVWEFDKPQKTPDHPTMKPVDLVTRSLEHASLPGEIVYDPFLGSGTTMVAAEQTGRICYGMEISPTYCAVALERLAGMGLEPRLVS